MKKTTKLAWLAGAMALAAGSLSPKLAHALSCVLEQPRVPEEGATAVPTNAVLLGYGWSSSERLLGPGGEVIPVERRVVAAPFYATPALSGYPVLVPLEELEPDSVYTLERDDHASWGDAEPSIHPVTFTTGPGPSVASPPLPVVVGAEPRLGAGFDGALRYIHLDVEHQGLLVVDLGNSFGEATSFDDLFLDPALSSDAPDASPRLEWVTTRQGLSVGYGDCVRWPSMAADNENARLGVLDLAGNFSGWVGVDLELPSVEEAQAAAEADRAAAYDRTFGKRDGRPPVCTFTPGGASNLGGAAAWLTLALAGLFGAGRRLRRPSR